MPPFPILVSSSNQRREDTKTSAPFFRMPSGSYGLMIPKYLNSLLARSHTERLLVREGLIVLEPLLIGMYFHFASFHFGYYSILYVCTVLHYTVRSIHAHSQSKKGSILHGSHIEQGKGNIVARKSPLHEFFRTSSYSSPCAHQCAMYSG